MGKALRKKLVYWALEKGGPKTLCTEDGSSRRQRFFTFFFQPNKNYIYIHSPWGPGTLQLIIFVIIMSLQQEKFKVCLYIMYGVTCCDDGGCESLCRWPQDYQTILSGHPHVVSKLCMMWCLCRLKPPVTQQHTTKVFQCTRQRECFVYSHLPDLGRSRGEK